VTFGQKLTTCDPEGIGTDQTRERGFDDA
jgi:hypothetical protein